jgi:hypothetical protein
VRGAAPFAFNRYGVLGAGLRLGSPAGILLGEFVVEFDFVVSDDALEPGPAPVSGFAGFIAVALLEPFAPADGFIELTPGLLAASELGAPGAELPTGPELAPMLVLVEPDDPIAPILVPALAPPPASPPVLSEPVPALTPALPPAEPPPPPPAPCANAFEVNAPSTSDIVAPSRIEDTFFFFIVTLLQSHPKNYPSHCGLADVPSKV